MLSTNAEIAARIEELLLHDPRVSCSEIAVSVKDQVATLRGRVLAPERKTVAVGLATTAPGCLAVVDELHAEFVPDLPDRVIAQNVAERLALLAASTREAVQAVIERGVVTLTGAVPTAWERATICDVALSARGVRRVGDAIGSLAQGSAACAAIALSAPVPPNLR